LRSLNLPSDYFSVHGTGAKNKKCNKEKMVDDVKIVEAKEAGNVEVF